MARSGRKGSESIEASASPLSIRGNDCPAGESESTGGDPDLAQKAPEEDGVDEGMKPRMDEEAPETAAFPGGDIIGLESEIGDQVPQDKPPEDFHTIPLKNPERAPDYFVVIVKTPSHSLGGGFSM